MVTERDKKFNQISTESILLINPGFLPLILLALQGPVDTLQEWANSSFSHSKIDEIITIEVGNTFCVYNTLFLQSGFVLWKIELWEPDMEVTENVTNGE